MLQTLVETAVSLVFPLECPSCGSALGPRPSVGVCRPCVASIRPIVLPFCKSCGRTVGCGDRCAHCQTESFHFDRAYAVDWYDGKIKAILHAFKFGGQKYLKNFFISRLSTFYSEHLADQHFDVIASVPMDRAQKRERGFDQADLLAAGLSKKISLPRAVGKIYRTRTKTPQHFLNKSERRSNLKDCFAVRPQAPFQEKDVLLVDDILTTGYTASECARLIKAAGARSVTVLAAARGSLG